MISKEEEIHRVCLYTGCLQKTGGEVLNTVAPGQYKYTPTAQLRGVVNVRLLEAVIPNSVYHVSEQNCIVWSNLAPDGIKLAHGHYGCVAALAAELAAKMAAAGHTGIAATYSRHTARVVLGSADAPFSLGFDSALLASALGMHQTTNTSTEQPDGTHAVWSAQPTCLTRARGVFYRLILPELAGRLGNSGVLETVPREPSDSITHFCLASPQQHAARRFRPAALRQIDLRIEDEHGNPQDLQGVRAVFVLEFTRKARC